MSFVVLNVLKSSIEQQASGYASPSCCPSILSTKTEEVEMAINIANISSCESSGKNTSRIIMMNLVSLEVLCPFEELLVKLNPSVHQ